MVQKEYNVTHEYGEKDFAVIFINFLCNTCVNEKDALQCGCNVPQICSEEKEDKKS